MTPAPRIGFVLEQALGHVTHADNLQTVLADESSIDARWYPVPYEVSGLPARVPVYGTNWTVRAGLRARRALWRDRGAGQLDALFVHTQVPAILLRRWMHRVPTIVSLDATPLQYDTMGEHYGHRPGNARIERLKWNACRRSLEDAAAIVAWSSWAKDGVVNGYGIAPDKVTIIPPGVWCDRWTRPDSPADAERVVRILFVGGDFERKGGQVLLSAFREVRARAERSAASPPVELHVVTKATLAPEPGLFVYTNLTPNAPELVALYHRCHVFCLPTRADMLAMVLSEAAAAGLAVVSTPVGAIPELVQDGTTGVLVPVDDAAALADALTTLVEEPDRREELARQARALVLEGYDARANAHTLLDLLRSVAARR